jgi:hypothetical protein
VQTINDYEFIEQDGELVLMTDLLGESTCLDPVFLISAVNNVGYLRRKPGQGWEIRNIDPSVVSRLRGAALVIVIEMDGDRVALAYDAPIGPLEYDEDDWAVTKALTVFWHKLARYWSGASGAP